MDIWLNIDAPCIYLGYSPPITEKNQILFFSAPLNMTPKIHFWAISGLGTPLYYHIYT